MKNIWNNFYTSFPFYKEEMKKLIFLAFPVLLAQASQTAITFVDTIMSGRYSTEDLAGVSLSTSIFLPLLLFGHGLLSILTPIISQLNGAGKRELIKNQTRQGLWLATFISIFIMFILYNGDKIITLGEKNSSIDPKMKAIATDFLRYIMWGIPGYLYYQVLRNQCEGLANTKPAMIIAFCALIINIPINYVFIYGKFGLPEFGGRGCAIAAVIVYWSMFSLILMYVRKVGGQKDIRQIKLEKIIDFKLLFQTFKLGFPLALALLFEVTLFAIVPLLIAPLGPVVVSAQQIVSIISSMAFVIPLSIAVATSIRVGFFIGRSDPKTAKRVAITSLIVAFLVSVCVAIFLLISGTLIISLFTSDAKILTIAGTLIFLLAIYQCSDYLQVVAASVLRAYKDTKSIFMITFFSYWIVGFPLGYLFAMTNILCKVPLGPAGFWIGFIIGLSVAAILMFLRMRFLLKQSLKV